MEAELELEEPTEMGGDTSTSEDDRDRGIIATSVEHCEPTAVAASGGRDAERCDDVPTSRKHAVSLATAIEREAKRAWSPRPSEASLASHPPTPSMVGHTSQSKECACTPISFRGWRVCMTRNGEMPR